LYQRIYALLQLSTLTPGIGVQDSDGNVAKVLTVVRPSSENIA